VSSLFDIKLKELQRTVGQVCDLAPITVFTEINGDVYRVRITKVDRKEMLDEPVARGSADTDGE